jgi:hypothetical protein
VEHRACSSVVERPFCIRKALGSIPNLSIFLFFFWGGLILLGGQKRQQHTRPAEIYARSAKTRERRSVAGVREWTLEWGGRRRARRPLKDMRWYSENDRTTATTSNHTYHNTMNERTNDDERTRLIPAIAAEQSSSTQLKEESQPKASGTRAAIPP